MTEQQAIDLLNKEHERASTDFYVSYGFGSDRWRSDELSATAAGEWLIDEHGCDEELAYEYSMAWVVLKEGDYYEH